MDAQLKAKWIEALRSGKYEQGTGYLLLENGNRNEYCCLGVLMTIQGIDILKEYPAEDDRGTCDLPLHFSGGLKYEQCSELAAMNDGSGEDFAAPKSFSQIADYIEKNL